MQLWPPVFHENKRCLDPHPYHTLTAGSGGAHPSRLALHPGLATASSVSMLCSDEPFPPPDQPRCDLGMQSFVLGVGRSSRKESPDDQTSPLLSSVNELHQVVRRSHAEAVVLS